MAQRVWGPEGTAVVRLAPVGEPSVSFVDPNTGLPDLAVRRICSRCNGTGATPWGWCFECLGERWTYVYLRQVRRVARWSQTFQQNRVPSPDLATTNNTYPI